MKFNRRTIRRLAVVIVGCCVAHAGTVSLAQDGPSLVVEPSDAPLMAPAKTWPPETTEPAPIYEEIAVPISAESTEVKAIPVAHIDYDVTRKARKRFGGSPFVDLVMVTQNPADGCFYEIPLCLPVCCTGEPKVESHCGLMGRGIVKYCYECGLEVEVKFRLRGDVEVEYGT